MSLTRWPPIRRGPTGGLISSSMCSRPSSVRVATRSTAPPRRAPGASGSYSAGYWFACGPAGADGALSSFTTRPSAASQVVRTHSKRGSL